MIFVLTQGLPVLTVSIGSASAFQRGLKQRYDGRILVNLVNQKFTVYVHIDHPPSPDVGVASTSVQVKLVRVHRIQVVTPGLDALA